MLKLALVSSVLAVGGTAAYVVHAHQASSTSVAAAAAPSVASTTAVAQVTGAGVHAAARAPALPPRPALPMFAFAPVPDEPGVTPAAELARLGLTSGPSRGDADAPVTIVVFQDNKCPFCEKSLGSLDKLLDDYPHKLRIIVKQFVVHPSAELSAEADYAADAQGKFWEMHDTIFQHQDELSREALIGYAGQLGLDVAQFTHALDDHEFKKQVDDDMAAGKEVGVQGTPAFLINGRKIVGAQSMQVFHAAIDEALGLKPASPAAAPAPDADDPGPCKK